MAENQNYSVDILWSEHDGLFLAQVKELPGCIADGATREEACRNIAVIIEEWLEVANEEGREIPPPLTVDNMEQFAEEARLQLEEEIETQVKAQLLKQLKKFVHLGVLRQQPSSIASWRKAGSSRFPSSAKAKA